MIIGQQMKEGGLNKIINGFLHFTFHSFVT